MCKVRPWGICACAKVCDRAVQNWGGSVARAPDRLIRSRKRIWDPSLGSRWRMARISLDDANGPLRSDRRNGKRDLAPSSWPVAMATPPTDYYFCTETFAKQPRDNDQSIRCTLLERFFYNPTSLINPSVWLLQKVTQHVKTKLHFPVTSPSLKNNQNFVQTCFNVSQLVQTCFSSFIKLINKILYKLVEPCFILCLKTKHNICTDMFKC